MRLFVCFGAPAPVADDELAAAEAAAAALATRHRGQQRGTSRQSFRGKYFLPGKQSSKQRPSVPDAKKPGTRSSGSADVAQGFMGAPLSSAPSPPSSSCSCSTASAATSSRSSTASSSPSVFSGALSPKRRQANGSSSSPAAGAAAVALCLLMVVFCGRVGATLLASTALYLFPRRWPAKTRRGDEEDDNVDSLGHHNKMSNRKGN